MAKLIAPLMSFGARGQLGGALVYSNWKGIATARKLVIPANPNSPAQQAQRASMKTIVNAWRNPSLTAAIRAAWNRLATTMSTAASGFNVFSSNLLRLVKEVPAASVVIALTDSAAEQIILKLVNLDDLTTGDEAGNFAIAYGDKPTNMVYGATGGLAAGMLSLDASGEFEAGDVIYVSIRKAGTETTVFERSGIIEVTLT